MSHTETENFARQKIGILYVIPITNVLFNVFFLVHHFMKTYGEAKVQLHSFLALKLGENVWSVLPFGYLISGENPI